MPTSPLFNTDSLLPIKKKKKLFLGRNWLTVAAKLNVQHFTTINIIYLFLFFTTLLYTWEFCKLKVVLLCHNICKTPYGFMSPLSSLSQCSTVGLELSCIKATVRCSRVGRMGDFAHNRVARVECLCLSLNGLSHLLQRMNARCLRCQHCKWIPPP